MAQEKLKAIDIDVGKGGVHLVDANELLLKEFPDYTFEKKDDSKFGGFVNDKRPLKYMYVSCFTPTYFGIDFGKAPDCAGRVTYWVAPFKYKTAGFDHQMVHSDFGFVWRFINHNIISLHDLPIKYNFEMSKRFYANIFQEYNTLLLDKIYNGMKRYINSVYGIGLKRGMPKVDLLSIDVDDIKNLTFGPRMPGKTYHLWYARSCMKPFLKPTIIKVED